MPLIFRVLLLRVFVVFLPVVASTQQPYFNPDHRIYQFADRLQHIYGLQLTEHRSTNKISFDEGSFLLSIKDSLEMSEIDRRDLDFFAREMGLNTERDSMYQGFWQQLYRNPAYLFELDKNTFELHINPFLNLRAGHERSDEKFIFFNKRGIELWGSLDNRFYFYGALHENQANFVNYIENNIDANLAIPGQGHYKPYQSSVVSAVNGYDFANANTYLGYQTSKHTFLELGYGRHMVGSGIRSVLLSNFAHNYLYLNFTVDVWKLHYQSMVAALSPLSSLETVGNTVLPKKYMATHYLSLDLSPKLEIGLFETVVFARQNQLEFHYLNPLMLFRTVEALIDSPDNVILGLNLDWSFYKRSSLYAQLMIDELRTSEFFSGDKWWGNKWAYQIGIKHFDLFNVDQLDAQLEYNKVRPYSYSHNMSLAGFPQKASASYSHFNQPLAHPLGSNFSEVIVRLRYRPLFRLFIEGQYLYSKVGRGQNGDNFGDNILIDNGTRIDDYGIEHLQGQRHTIQSVDLRLSYMFVHDLYLDLYFKHRSDTGNTSEDVNTRLLGMGIRYNIDNRNIDY